MGNTTDCCKGGSSGEGEEKKMQVYPEENRIKKEKGLERGGDLSNRTVEYAKREFDMEKKWSQSDKQQVINYHSLFRMKYKN